MVIHTNTTLGHHDFVSHPLPRITTHELKKGDYAILANGWVARIEDNTRHNTRVCTVWGHFTETGSVYAHDILVKIEATPGPAGKPSLDRILAEIELTPQQKRIRDSIAGLL